MQWWFKFSVIFSLMAAISAPAVTPDCDALLRALDNPACVYIKSHCATNALNLVEYARAEVASFDITRAKVIYLKSPVGKIHSFASRGLNDWSFHVIVEYDGLIFDQDMSDRSQPLPVLDYLNTMFLLDQGRNGDMHLVVIPALDYVMELGHPDELGRMIETRTYTDLDSILHRYPVVPAISLLENGGELPLLFSRYSPDGLPPNELRLETLDNIIYWRDNGVMLAMVAEAGAFGQIFPEGQAASQEMIRKMSDAIDRRASVSAEIARIRDLYRVEFSKRHPN